MNRDKAREVRDRGVDFVGRVILVGFFVLLWGGSLIYGIPVWVPAVVTLVIFVVAGVVVFRKRLEEDPTFWHNTVIGGVIILILGAVLAAFLVNMHAAEAPPAHEDCYLALEFLGATDSNMGEVLGSAWAHIQSVEQLVVVTGACEAELQMQFVVARYLYTTTNLVTCKEGCAEAAQLTATLTRPVDGLNLAGFKSELVTLSAHVQDENTHQRSYTLDQVMAIFWTIAILGVAGWVLKEGVFIFIELPGGWFTEVIINILMVLFVVGLYNVLYYVGGLVPFKSPEVGMKADGLFWTGAVLGIFVGGGLSFAKDVLFAVQGEVEEVIDNRGAEFGVGVLVALVTSVMVPVLFFFVLGDALIQSAITGVPMSAATAKVVMIMGFIAASHAGDAAETIYYALKNL